MQINVQIINNQQKTNFEFLLNNEIHEYHTRIQNNIHYTQNRTNIGINNPFFQLSIVFNHLPLEIKQATLNLFIKRLKTYYNIN